MKNQRCRQTRAFRPISALRNLPVAVLQPIVVHLTEDSIHRGEARDLTGYRADVRELTTADRQSFVGNYMSPELGVVYRILERNGSLLLEHPRLGRLPLTHNSGDHFSLPGRHVVRLSFLRADSEDPASAIIGLMAEAFAWGATARFELLDGGVGAVSAGRARW